MVKSILNRRRRTKKRQARKRGGRAVTEKASTEPLTDNLPPSKENATEPISMQDNPKQKTNLDEETPSVETSNENTEKEPTSSLKSLAGDATTSAADAAKLAVVASNPELMIANDVADITNNDGGYAPFSPMIWAGAITAAGNLGHKVSDLVKEGKEIATSAVNTAVGIGATVAEGTVNKLEKSAGIDLSNTDPKKAAKELEEDLETATEIGKVLSQDERFQEEIGKAADVAEELEESIVNSPQVEEAKKQIAEDIERTGEDIALDAIGAVPGVSELGTLAKTAADMSRQGEETVEKVKGVKTDAEKKVQEKQGEINKVVEGVTSVVKDAQKKVEKAEAQAKAATEVKVPEIPKIQTPQIPTAAAAGGGKKKTRSTRKKVRRSAKKSMSRVTRSLRKFLRSG